MIKKFKRALIAILLSIICGSICGKLVYNIYADSISVTIESKKIYLIQSGAYSSYDSMLKNVALKNYVYYEDDGLYRSIVALTLDYDNIEKIKNTYKDKVIVKEFYSNDRELNKKLEYYDKMLKNSNSTEEIKEIINQVLVLYKNNNSILSEVVS